MWSVFVNKKIFLRNIKRYKCKSVYDWYKKVIKKTVLKIDGIQNAIQFFRYMSGIQTKKSRIKSYTDLFLLLCNAWGRWACLINLVSMFTCILDVHTYKIIIRQSRGYGYNKVTGVLCPDKRQTDSLHSIFMWCTSRVVPTKIPHPICLSAQCIINPC